jgi:hypothetical protein
MVTDTAKNIIKYLETRKQATAKELGDFLGISRQALYKQLGKLLSLDKIKKIGRPPKVFYQVKVQAAVFKEAIIAAADKEIIEKNYLFITPAGQKLQGMEGFVYWCKKNNLDAAKTAPQYTETLKKFEAIKTNGLVDGTPKIKNTFPQVFLDKIYYLDFYSIERFGKTKLGQMLLYAKQSQNKILMDGLIAVIQPKVGPLIKVLHIDAVGFIPPTVKRELQFMRELERRLDLKVPVIKIVKIQTPVSVPQKSLGKLEDRVENARDTIFVEESRKFGNVLLIDDAIGSGATMNETARKIREQKLCFDQLIGLAITGSFKGFDIISEV